MRKRTPLVAAVLAALVVLATQDAGALVSKTYRRAVKASPNTSPAWETRPIQP